MNSWWLSIVPEKYAENFNALTSARDLQRYARKCQKNNFRKKLEAMENNKNFTLWAASTYLLSWINSWSRWQQLLIVLNFVHGEKSRVSVFTILFHFFRNNYDYFIDTNKNVANLKRIIFRFSATLQTKRTNINFSIKNYGSRTRKLASRVVRQLSFTSK